MDQPTVLRETKIGQKGFIKEDVLTYLDELNSKIESLEQELKNASVKGPSDPQEIIKFRNQVDNLQEKLNKSNQALREAKKENEELQKQIAALKAGGAGAAAAAPNPQAQAALEAAKKEIDNLRNQLKAAEQKSAAGAPANAQMTAALEAAKKEIDSLRNQVKTAEAKAIAAEQKAAAAAKAPAPAAPAVDNSALNAELAKAKQDLAKAVADLEAKTNELKSKSAELEAKNGEVSKKSAELEAKIRESAEKDSKLEQLTKDAAAAAKKDEEIAQLNAEVAQLREAASNPAALMGSLFSEAQKTVTQLKLQAEQEAEKTTKEAADNAAKTTREAEEKAAKTTREADEKAQKVISEANATADKTVKDANATAEQTIRQANEQAKATVDDANAKADKINEMSATVRNMLLNEIESINGKFADLGSTITKLTNQTSDKMNEAKLIIGEARKAVAPAEDTVIKHAEAPKAEFTASKAPAPAVAPAVEKLPEKPADPFANVTGGTYNHGAAPAQSKNPFASAPKPAAPAYEAPKPAPKKTVSNFNFDMSDLLKAAEEEAAKEETE